MPWHVMDVTASLVYTWKMSEDNVPRQLTEVGRELRRRVMMARDSIAH